MNNIKEIIESLVKQIFNETANIISKKFDISLDEAYSVWDDFNVDLSTIKIKKNITKSKTNISPTLLPTIGGSVGGRQKLKERSEDNNEKPTSCIHKMLRGKRPGEPCGEKISSKSQTRMYCIKHINQENKVISSKSEKKKSNEDNEDKEDKEDNEDKDEGCNYTKQELKIKHVIHKNKFGNFVHLPTGLVFKSRTENVIYGRQDEEGNILDLTDEDIQICKKLEFKVVKTKKEEMVEEVEKDDKINEKRDDNGENEERDDKINEEDVDVE